jgi:glycosyltransferase involved in cell wall biosynthesis
VSLIHDNLSRYSPSSLQSIFTTADKIVFSSVASRKNATAVHSPFASAPVIPQGLLQDSFGTGNRASARQRIRARLGIPLDSKIVLACGMRDLRKGADLFVEVARQVLDANGDEVHFLWVGDPPPATGGSRAEWTDEPGLSVAGRLHWIDATSDPEEYFLAADIFVLTSRDDPFPCVVHEAMAAGLKIVVFEGSGGAPEQIAEGCGIPVPYLDTRAMAEAVLAFLAHPLRHERLGERAERRVRAHYVFSQYATAIMDLVTGEDSQMRRARRAPKVFFSQREWSISGVNSVTGELAGELNQRGIDAQLLFVSLPEADRSFLPDVPQVFLDAGRQPLPRQWRLIENFLTANAPCILFVGYDTKTSAIAPRLPGSVGIVGIIHGDDSEHYGHVRRLGLYMNRILAVSEEIARKARLYVGAFEPDRIKCIPNFVTGFDAPKREVGSSTEPIGLIYTGRIIEHPKRMSDLAAIARRLDRDGIPFRLTLIGRGAARKDLESELEPLIRRGSVVFLGRCDRREVRRHLQASDLFLLTSESEGMPISLLEAMAQRCVPLVTALPSGIPELVSDAKNGFTFGVGDVEGFSGCIARLHEDREQVATLSEAAYQHVWRNFSGAAVAELYATEIRQIWDEITSGSHVRPPSLIDGPFPGISVPPDLIKELHSS